jgi:hypothetical protein
MKPETSLSRALVLVTGAVLYACTANTGSGVGSSNSALSCDDFRNSGTIDASLDGNVKVFLEATGELKNAAGDIRGSVKKACIAVATDLGAPDTWSAHGDDDASITSNDGSGACDAAAAKIKTIMEAHAEANFALVVTRGHCHEDFDQVRQCDQKCTTDESCSSGDVTTRCEPGQVSVACQGKCKLKAECEGTVDVRANCTGSCEGTCTGQCSGTCTHPDGKKIDNDPSCNGKCSATCTGTCQGACTITASEGLDCGANVRCKGECEGTVTAPTCETKCSPPSCKVDTRCYDVCSTQVQAKTVCEPSRVTLLADVSVHADVQKLVTTVNANLSALIDVAETRGRVVADAGDKLAASAKVLLAANLSLDAKSTACAVAGAEESAKAATNLAASANGGAAVMNTCAGHAN